MKHLMGKAQTVMVDFMDDQVQVKQLSVNQVLELQKELAVEDEAESLGSLSKIVRATVVGAEDLSDEEIQSFPLGELVKLSEEVMRVSGLKAESGNG